MVAPAAGLSVGSPPPRRHRTGSRLTFLDLENVLAAQKDLCFLFVCLFFVFKSGSVFWFKIITWKGNGVASLCTSLSLGL